ncbi:MAG: Uma2 family endonuclease, partial [Cyanobacteria bacterium P01_A01_bin.84]
RTPEYFWFDPDSLELAGFLLLGGSYQPIETNEKGWLWSQQLELYLGVREKNLRFFTSEGELVPTPEEVARKESQRTERLAAKLRELGVDPDSL